MTDIVLVNGRLTDQISARDRGLAYGDGVFETVLCVDGKLILWEQHLRRLSNSLSRLNIQPFQTDELLSHIQPHLLDTGRIAVKIIVTRGTAQRGYAIPEICQPNTIIFISDINKVARDILKTGIKACVCDTHLGHQPELAGIKHLNRLEQILAQQELDNSKYQEGIMLGSNGEVVEAISHNLFLVKNGELFTPTLSECGVEGIMRGFIVENARALGISTHIQTISIEQLMLADEIFLTNSINGIWPICELDGNSYEVGPVTCQLNDKVVNLYS